MKIYLLFYVLKSYLRKGNLSMYTTDFLIYVFVSFKSKKLKKVHTVDLNIKKYRSFYF